MTRSAVEIATLMAELAVEAETSLREHRQHEGQVDKEIGAIYHELEIVDLNPFTAFLVMQRLQERLRTRRAIKHELATLASLNMSMSNAMRAKIQSNKASVLRIARRQPDLIKNNGYIARLINDHKRQKEGLDLVFHTEENQVGVGAAEVAATVEN